MSARPSGPGERRWPSVGGEPQRPRCRPGLGAPPRALSFEFTTIQRDVAYRCLERLAELGAYRFILSLGESHALARGAWASREEMAAQIAALPHEANSGDVYCVLES